MDTTSYFTVRQAAAMALKNSVKESYKQMPESSRTYIRSNILPCVQDSNAQMRGYAGNVITEIVKQGGIMSWPQVLSELITLISNTDGHVSIHAQEGAMGALLKICEDNRKALDRDYSGQRPLSFLFPNLLKFTTSRSAKVRGDALAALNIFIPDKTPTVMENLEAIMQHLSQLAADESDEVRKHVCRAFVHIADIAPQHIAPHMKDLVDYMVTQQLNTDNADLALDAAEFWLCVGEDEKLRDCLGPYLDKIVPVLLQSMIYSEDDIMRLEGEKEDAEQEDREEDIKPTFASAKSARLTGDTNGDSTAAINGSSAYTEDDDLDEGEIDDSDDDSSGDPEEQWNLRKCSAAALDVLASVFHEHVFNPTLPYLKENLNHSEWPNREAAVLALGAIAEGCMAVVEPSLPELVPFLISLLNDPEPVVRQITCWSLGRYSSWASHLDDAGKERFFVPMMDGILKRMLDPNKRVQEAAASAFANLEEQANTELKLYCPVIVRQFVQCFAKYKDRNMFILYDCVQTLAEHVGPALAENGLVNLLMPALIDRWNKVSDQSREMFPLLECLSYVATALGNEFARFAPGIFKRCINIIQRNLEEEMLYKDNPHLDEPDKDFLVTSLDLLSAIIQALEGPASAQLVGQEPNFFPMLAMCMQDDNNDVRQSAYALLGDCAIYVFQQLQPQLAPILEILIAQLEISQVMDDAEKTGYAVINNACWSAGEIAMRQMEGMQPYVDKLLHNFASILVSDKVPRSLSENAAIALGRLGLGCAPQLASVLSQIAPYFQRAIANVAWTDEKAHALSGFMQIILVNPPAMEKTLLEFFREMAKADPSVVIGVEASPPGYELRKTFQQVRTPVTRKRRDADKSVSPGYTTVQGHDSRFRRLPGQPPAARAGTVPQAVSRIAYGSFDAFQERCDASATFAH